MKNTKSKFIDREGNLLVRGRLYTHPFNGVYLVKSVSPASVNFTNYDHLSFHKSSNIEVTNPFDVTFLRPVPKETIQEVVRGLKSTVRGLESSIKYAPQ
ncbi:MAG: hypothetical protein WCX73_05485 [Candidatus Pacearchaeota archaeon]|jgi:hypothetical protein